MGAPTRLSWLVLVRRSGDRGTARGWTRRVFCPWRRRFGIVLASRPARGPLPSSAPTMAPSRASSWPASAGSCVVSTTDHTWSDTTPRTIRDMTWNEGPLLGFDLETTGVDPRSDLPVQVALIRWEPCGCRYRNVFIVDPGCEVPARSRSHPWDLDPRKHGTKAVRSARRRRSCTRPSEGSSRSGAGGRHEREFRCHDRSDDVPELRSGADRVASAVDPLVIDRKVDSVRSGKRRLDALCETYDVALGSPHDGERRRCDPCARSDDRLSVSGDRQLRDR